MKLFFKIQTISLILMMVLSSCSNDENSDGLPYNNINEFKVEHEGKQIYGKIEGATIELNWPYNAQLPATLKPSIVLSEKASVLPLSGAEIDPVKVTTYRVKAEDGSEKTYTLKINYLQPIINVEGVETPIEASFRHDYTIFGEGFSKNKNENKVSLVAEDGSKEYPLSIDEAQVLNDNGYADRLKIVMPKKEDMPAGSYKLKVVYGNRSVTTKKVYFNVKDLKLPYITIPESMISEIEGTRCIVLNSNEKHELKGENFEAFGGASQIFFTWRTPTSQGSDSSELTVVNSNSIQFEKSDWVDANKLYQRAYIDYRGEKNVRISVYLRDNTGNLVGVYFK